MSFLFKETKGGDLYQGIPMMTAQGVHEKVAELVGKVFPDSSRKEANVLDLAAGQGALSQRLQDLGFGKITAWELEKEQFRPNGIKVEGFDLNKNFSEFTRERFDLITAVEIIEHLENPHHFLREISKLLKPKGYLVLSTPNIDSAVGRIQFLLNGEFRWFDQNAYEKWGHIQPLSNWQIEKIVTAAGLVTAEEANNSDDGKIAIEPGKKYMVKGLAAMALYPIMRGSKKGDINLRLIKHREAA